MNKHVGEGQGTGVFLFATKEPLLDAEDILSAALVSGRNTEKVLTG